MAPDNLTAADYEPPREARDEFARPLGQQRFGHLQTEHLRLGAGSRLAGFEQSGAVVADYPADKRQLSALDLSEPGDGRQATALESREHGPLGAARPHVWTDRPRPPRSGE